MLPLADEIVSNGQKAHRRSNPESFFFPEIERVIIASYLMDMNVTLEHFAHMPTRYC